MDELPPKAAALLRAAQSDHNPSRADSERVRTALAAALLAPPVGDVTGEATNAVGVSKGTSGLLSASWIKAVAVLGVVGSASLWAYLDAAPEPARAPSVQVAAKAAREVPSSVATQLPAAQVAREPHARDVEEAPAPTGGSAQAEKIDPAPRLRRQINRAPKAAEPVVVSAPTTELTPEGELALMRRAIAQLNAGAPRGALELLSQHAARFPNGVMSEERDGLRAIALCKDGDVVQGKASALSFLRLYERSAMAGRVRGACKEGAP